MSAQPPPEPGDSPATLAAPATLALIHNTEPLQPSDPATDTPVAYSEDHIASIFTKRHGQDWRFIAEWNQWYKFDGTIWRKDSTLAVFDIMRSICREVATWGGEATIAQKRVMSSAKTIAATEKIARSARETIASVSQWDSDPWLLATPEAVLNLKSGEQRPATREDYLTKQTAAHPGGDCPIWREFLHTSTGGDTERQRYLQRWAGYACTGVTGEHALAFFYGTGANGKSVFLDTIRDILGDYATVAGMDMFLESKNERHPAELADLLGKRLVTAQETDDGRRWAESKIKEMSAAKKIKARFMAKDWFEYVPQFKLLFAGNHKPGLRSVDEAIRRRVHIVPFTVTIPAEDRDPYLCEKLKTEYPGILEWMLEGCADWQLSGLTAPKSVTDATESYMESQDALQSWIEENCEVSRTAATLQSSLYKDWKSWCDAAGEFSASSRRFAQSLETRGYTRQEPKSSKGYLIKGLSLKLPEISRRYSDE